MHVTKFAKNLEEQHKYLKTTGVAIYKESKLQFYTEQMIDSGMFDKKDITDWEDNVKDDKTWAKAKM